MDLFPDAETVRDIQKELDALIEAGIVKLTTLLLNSDASKPDSLETLYLQNNLLSFFHVFLYMCMHICCVILSRMIFKRTLETIVVQYNIYQK
jgi:hypothetical protein